MTERAHTQASYNCLKRVSQTQNELISNVKRKTFKDAVHKVFINDMIWSLAKWTKSKKKSLLLVSLLCTSCDAELSVFNFSDKVNMFKNIFYSQTVADLSNISDKKALMSHTSFNPSLNFFTDKLSIFNEMLYEDIWAVLASKLL